MQTGDEKLRGPGEHAPWSVTLRVSGRGKGTQSGGSRPPSPAAHLSWRRVAGEISQPGGRFWFRGPPWSGTALLLAGQGPLWAGAGQT